MDHLRRSLLNTYTDQPLDRSAHRRKDSAWLTAQAADTRSEYLVLDGHRVVTVNGMPLVLSQQQFNALNSSLKPSLLGIKKSDGIPVFLVNITEPEKTLSDLVESILDGDKTAAPTAEKQFREPALESRSLWDVTAKIPSELASIYSHALLLNHWHVSTRFCTRCGSSLALKEGGSTQQCSNEPCAHVEFPRINPAVIMRVTKDNKILLARQATWPEHRYSVLAGFVEVGETIEHTVEREVMEEVGVAVHNIHYHSSQPWPFPNSLMLGYTAEATSEVLDLEQDDIEQALWLSADELKMKMAEGTVLPPPALSISNSLINDWFENQTGTSLNKFKPNRGW